MLFVSILLAFLPSLLWLAVFLRQDAHPEPNKLVRRVFLIGMLVTIPTLAIEALLNCPIKGCLTQTTPGMPPLYSAPLFNFQDSTRNLLYLFVGIAFIEETMKYLAVRLSALKKPEFNEPIDAMLYMIIAALGFAAVENIFTVSSSQVQNAGLWGANGVLALLGARSLSATLLHALTSGIVGYALAKSFFSKIPKHFLLSAGIVVATMIHGVYNGLIGGLILKGSAENPFLNVGALLIITSAVLIIMLKSLRRQSFKHQWKNVGYKAQEIS